MEKLILLIQQIGFPETIVKKNSITIGEDKIKLLTKSKGKYTLLLKGLDKENKLLVVDRYTHLKKISFPENFDVTEILFPGLWLGYQKLLNAFLQLNKRKIKEIAIDDEVENILFAKKTIRVSPIKIQEIIFDAKSLNSNAKAQRGYFELYHTNKLLKKHLGISVAERTLTHKGDFTFLVDRFNLRNKFVKKDFEKCLSDSDLNSLQQLFDAFLRNEVFEKNFMNHIDEYFIKQRLSEIISLGRKILALKSDELSSKDAKKIIIQLSEEKPIKQLETIWQKYFEKYLLYLIFTYREFYPKVSLLAEGEKKYPDFIGINHYGGVDIIEIKTHLTPALTFDSSHKNFSFSLPLSKAIIQSMNYMDALMQEKNLSDDKNNEAKKKLLDENIHRPRAIIIISSWDKIVSKFRKGDRQKIERDFTKLRNSLNNIEIVTFDEILNMADRYCKNILENNRQEQE